MALPSRQNCTERLEGLTEDGSPYQHHLRNVAS
jgi:hypothetical protein